MLERQGLMGDDEERSLGARETRLRRASDKELARSAMRSAARYGYFVFDDLATDEAGLIDYLTVGPPDVTVIVVRDDRGYVSRGDRYEKELLLDGQPFEDDPRRQAQELARDVSQKLFEGQRSVSSMICFLYAQLEVKDHEIPLGTTPLWELPWALDPEGEVVLTPADIEEIAEKVQKIYGRPPIVTPQSEER